ncbi:hypothetical protein ACS0TY_027747 [Phlomoides rotata]
MRGVGGPLLCISDLLSDVGEENSAVPHDHVLPLDTTDVSKLPASDLPKLFQENFNELKEALDGADHSWTALTLKLGFVEGNGCDLCIRSRTEERKDDFF